MKVGHFQSARNLIQRALRQTQDASLWCAYVRLETLAVEELVTRRGQEAANTGTALEPTACCQVLPIGGGLLSGRSLV